MKCGDDAGGLEHRSQTFLDVSRLVRLVANQAPVRAAAGRLACGGLSRKEPAGPSFPIHVFDVFCERRVVGHPDQVVRRQADFVCRSPWGGPWAMKYPTCLPDLEQECSCRSSDPARAPRAEAGNHVDRPLSASRVSAAIHASVSVSARGVRTVKHQRAGEKGFRSSHRNRRGTARGTHPAAETRSRRMFRRSPSVSPRPQSPRAAHRLRRPTSRSCTSPQEIVADF